MSFRRQALSLLRIIVGGIFLLFHLFGDPGIKLFGWFRFAAWHLTRWFVPNDKLDVSLEYDTTILMALPSSWQGYYMSAQDARRWEAERKWLRCNPYKLPRLNTKTAAP